MEKIYEFLEILDDWTEIFATIWVAAWVASEVEVKVEGCLYQPNSAWSIKQTLSSNIFGYYNFCGFRVFLIELLYK